MYLTGFADEAGADLATQIEATKRLGWRWIETRNIGEKNLASLSDAEFEEVEAALAASGIGFNCYGSRIANWQRAPRSDEDFEASRKELVDALPRMKKLGIKLVRGMSFKLTGDEQFDSPELEKIIFRKVGELVKICADNGIVYGHENCMNYGGQSPVHTLRLIENIDSPNFRLIFDTGNPVFTYWRLGEQPYKTQNAWEFYKQIREFIAYIHIKDGFGTIEADGKISQVYTFAGEGEGHVRAILTDLHKSGYDGGFSIEPHMATVFHDTDNSGDDEVKKVRKMETYVEYGKRFEKLLAECGYQF